MMQMPLSNYQPTEINTELIAMVFCLLYLLRALLFQGRHKQILIWTIGIVFLTLIVNATTTSGNSLVGCVPIYKVGFTFGRKYEIWHEGVF